MTNRLYDALDRLAQTTYADTGLTNGTQYCYKVQATRGTVKSADSNQACATPKTGGGPTFKRGDSVYVAPHEKHCFVADPGTPVQFICVIPSKNQCRL